MTGNDLYSRTLALLGYLNTSYLNADMDNLLKRMPDVIEQVCLDLKMPKIYNLSDEIVATEEQCDALCYGTAMIVALMEGDGEKNELFTKIYNAKRATALSKIDKIVDKLPTASYGVG